MVGAERFAVHSSIASSIHSHPDPLRVLPLTRIEEVMSNLYITDIRLVKAEVEAAGGKNGSKGEIKLAICQTTQTQVSISKQFHPLGLGAGLTSCQDIGESLC